MIVVLGELGGQDEYGLVEAMKAGAITKPVVAWVGRAELQTKNEGPVGRTYMSYLCFVSTNYKSCAHSV